MTSLKATTEGALATKKADQNSTIAAKGAMTERADQNSVKRAERTSTKRADQTYSTMTERAATKWADQKRKHLCFVFVVARVS